MEGIRSTIRHSIWAVLMITPRGTFINESFKGVGFGNRCNSGENMSVEWTTTVRAPAPCGRCGGNAEACTYEIKVGVETGVADKHSVLYVKLHHACRNQKTPINSLNSHSLLECHVLAYSLTSATMHHILLARTPAVIMKCVHHRRACVSRGDILRAREPVLVLVLDAECSRVSVLPRARARVVLYTRGHGVKQER